MSKAADVLAALGGTANVTELDGCITRLRVRVADPDRVDGDALKAAGAYGVVVHGSVVQVVVGPEADDLAAQIARLR